MKVLEVTLKGDGCVKFDTDVDVTKNPDQVFSVASKAAFSMVTDLWGGKEKSVMAIIRALAIADLAMSVNTNEMLVRMKESAMSLKKDFMEARRQFEKSGGKVVVFGPGVKPHPSKS